MSIVNKNKTKATSEVTTPPVPEKEKLDINFTLDELEFIIRLIGSSNFKGNDLMFIYELVNKLQNLYLDKKGVQ